MSREALVFSSKFDDASAWRDLLLAELPDLEFRDDPDIGDPGDVHYALVWKPPVGFFARFPNLKLVTNLGAGIDSLVGRDDLVPVPICRLNDPGMIQLMNSYVLFAAIRYARDIPVFEEAKRRGKWTYVHPRPLSEISVGVLGLGELGGPVAQALKDAGFHVRGWSRTPKDIPGVQCLSGRAGLDSILASSEIVVSMLPLTPETRFILGAREFALMPKGVKFINASRGAVVDEDALIAALRSGHVGGATLDVFLVEPLPEGHPLWSFDNVLITPHLASIAVPKASAKVVADNIRRVRQGLPPLHQTNPARGY
jgi:glyoxylate/hydroxypyruvate reductase A